jgi:hypothetical protein
MKKLFLVLLLLASTSASILAANTFNVTYIASNGSTMTTTPSIERGENSTVKVRLTITNPSGILPENYTFKGATGLYIKNNPTSSNVAAVPITINNNELRIEVGINAGTSLYIDMDVWAGQCFTFLASELSDKDLSTPFSIWPEGSSTSLNLAGNSKINIRKGAFLNYFEDQNAHVVMPDNNKMATFSYVFVNNSGDGLNFNGNFSFQESAVWPAFNIRQIKFYKWDKVSWVLIETKSNPADNLTIGLNDNSFVTNNVITIPINLSNGEKIKVEEIVQLNGCFQNGGSRSSLPLISWGNAPYDMCATPAGNPLESFMLEKTFSPNLVITTLNGANHYCYGGGENLRSYKIVNTGNDVAKNILVNLMSGDYFYNSPFLIKYVDNVNNDNQNIYITVNGFKYILRLDKYNIDFNDPKLYSTTDRPSFVPGDVPPWTTDGYGLYTSSLTRKKGQAPFTRFVPVNAFLTMDEYKRYQKITTPFTFSTQCIGGDLTSVKLIKDLYADEFKLANSTDDFAPLEIKPGDEVIFYWKEVNCCFGNEAINNSFTNSQVFVQYDDLCGLKQVNFGFGVSAIQHKFLPAAASGTTLGDFDRCRSTTDGLVERISATIQQYGAGVESPRFPDRYAFINGRIVFRIYVQNGLDLDKSLSQPFDWGWTQQRGYDNATDSELYVNNLPSGCKGVVCAADPVCNLTNVITNNNDKYYVRLRPNDVGQGKFLIPQSIVLKEFDNQIPPPNANLLMMPGLNPELIFDNNSSYANQLYEIAYNVEDLVAFYKAELNLTTVDKLTAVNALLNQCVLDFDLRAYCYGDGKPAYKVVMYHDRCSDGIPTQYSPSSCSPGFTSMQPIAAFGNSMIVNCPGCKIPGANIEISSLVRSENSRGLKDANLDRLPDNDHDQLPDVHPTLRNVAMGDEMTAKFSCYMSDGESTNGLGISKSELETAADAGNPNFYLDNFMIEGQFTGGAITRGTNKNIEIIYVRMTYNGREKIYQIGNLNDPFLTTHIFFPSDGSFVLRAKISDFYSINETVPNSFAPGFDNRIDFELHYQIGDMGDAITTSEITYAPYYTPCDYCNELTNTMVLVNPADNPRFFPFTLETLANVGGAETLWKCSGFSNRFKFIPYKQLAAFNAGDNNCTKFVGINFTGNFLPDGSNTDYFKEEYRTFLKSDLVTEVLVPNGYIPFKIEITNSFKINNTLKKEIYLITNPDLIVTEDNPNNAQFNNNEYNKRIKLSVKFNDVNAYPTYDINAFIGQSNVKTVKDAYPDGTVYDDTARMFIRGDEFYNVSIVVSYKVDPDAVCSSLDERFVWQGTGSVWNSGKMFFSNKANSPSFTYKNVLDPMHSINPQFRAIEANPHAVFLPTATYQVDDVNGMNGVVASYEKPIAKLDTRNLGVQSFTLSDSKLIQIPIEISNEKINSWKTNNADFPYIQIYGDALAKGLVFKGVYKGNVNITSPTAANYYDEYKINSTNLTDEGILVGIDFQAAHVRDARWNPIPMIPANVALSQYTLVFENTCPENCNQNIGCGTENFLPPNCLGGADNLKIKVGWNCNNYPSFQDLRDHKTCGAIDNVIKYSVGIALVGLTVNTTIKDNENLDVAIGDGQMMELKPCGVENIYTVKLNSCRPVGFDTYEIEFPNLSNEITITQSGHTSDNPILVVRDVNNINLFHITPTSSAVLLNGGISIDFIIKTSCNIPNQSLKTLVRSKTFCMPFAQVNFTINNPLKVKVNPATMIADNIALSSADVTVNSQNQLAVQYTVAGVAGATVTSFDNTILVQVRDGASSIYSETITIPAGTANGTVTKLISPGITSCNIYDVDLTTKRGYVPPCGVDGNGAVIPSCVNTFDDPAVSKSVVFGSGLNPFITTSTGYASFLCGTGGSVTLVAYPSGLSYRWRNPSGVVLSSTTETVVVSEIGIYTVEVTNTCGTYTASASVVNSLDINCPAPICPGELPNISVTNFNGVVGSYTAQWYDPNGSDGNDPADLAADILMDNGIFVSGYYYAAAVTPTCTLRTNAVIPQKCPIEVLRAPQAHHITSDKPSGDSPILFLCDGNSAILSVTNKTVNAAFATDVIWSSGQITTDDITVPQGSYEKYFITAIDVETSCRSVSNEIVIIRPYVHIRRECENGSQIKLTATSNFDVTSDKYKWYFDGQPLIDGVDEVEALQAGVYTVEETATGCSLVSRCWGIKENLITTVQSDEQLSVQDGGFEGITATQAGLGFETDFEPLDRTDYDDPNVVLPLDYTIGKFMINGGNLEASDWNPNTPPSWVNSNTNYSGTGALLIDGDSKSSAQLIWGKTVPVTHGVNYLYRFKVRNIDLLTQYPVQEIPELFVQISYIDDQNISSTYRTYKQAIFNNGQSPWLEFSSYTQALPFNSYNCTQPAEVQSVRLELFMEGGGSIGRDLSIDDFSLIPVGICQSTIDLNLPCNTALAELDNNYLVVCPGNAAQFNVINAPPGLTYVWQKTTDGVVMNQTDGNAATFNTPALNLIDPLKPLIATYQVIITDPVNNCQTRLAATAVVSPRPTISISSEWTGSNCERSFVAEYNGLGSPSQYEWYLNGSLVNETTANYVVANLQENDFVQSKLATAWCAEALPLESNSIVMHDLTVTANAGLDKKVCFAESVQIGVPAIAGASYSWMPILDLDDAHIAEPIVTPSGTQTSVLYELSTTDVATGCVSTDQVVVTINPLPTIVVTNPPAVCAPSTVDITLPAITVGSTTGLVFTYFTDAATTNALLTPTAVSVSGTYYIKGTTADGCVKIASVVVTINPLPVIVVTNPLAVCAPGTVDLTQSSITAGSTTGLVFTYFRDAATTNAVLNPAAVSVSETYYIKGTTASSCVKTEPVVVTINPLPTVVTHPTSICAPGTVDLTLPSVTAGSTTGLVFTYFSDAATTNAVLNPTAVSVSETYYIKGTTAAGCIKTEPVVVTINPLPTLIVTNPAALCEPGTVDLTLPSVTSGSTTGLVYTYFRDVATTNGLLNPASVATSGTYYIKGTTVEGCVETAPIVVTIYALPSLVITNPSATVTPNVVDITLPAVTSGSTPGLIFTYFNDIAATSILSNPNAVSLTGTYYIKAVLPSTGCTVIAPVEVGISTGLDVDASSGMGTLKVDLSPNPFSKNTYITISGANYNYVKVTLLDMNGKVVFENAHVPNNDSTPLGEDLPSAMYIVQVIDGEKTKTIKIVKIE